MGLNKVRNIAPEHQIKQVFTKKVKRPLTLIAMVSYSVKCKINMQSYRNRAAKIRILKCAKSSEMKNIKKLK